MSVSLLRNTAFLPSISLGIQTISSAKMRRTRSSLNQETPSQKNPGCDGTGGSSVPELRVFIRRKRVKKTVEVIAKEVKEESSGKKVMLVRLPDIEDFSYSKDITHPQSTPSKTVRLTGEKTLPQLMQTAPQKRAGTSYLQIQPMKKNLQEAKKSSNDSASSIKRYSKSK